MKKSRSPIFTFGFVLSVLLAVVVLVGFVSTPFNSLQSVNFDDLKVELGWRYRLPLYTADACCKITFAGVTKEIELRGFDRSEDVQNCFQVIEKVDETIVFYTRSPERFHNRTVHFKIEEIEVEGKPLVVLIKPLKETGNE